MHSFANNFPPIIFFCAAPKPSKAQHSESKSRKRERVSCSSSDGSQSGSEASDSSEVSAASSEPRRKKHHKEKKRSKKAKDYSRKRGSNRSIRIVFSHFTFRPQQKRLVRTAHVAFLPLVSKEFKGEAYSSLLGVNGVVGHQPSASRDPECCFWSKARQNGS